MYITYIFIHSFTTVSEFSMEHICPICKNELVVSLNTVNVDFKCNKYDSHFFAKRLQLTHQTLSHPELLKIKVKFQIGDEPHWYLRVNYDQGTSEVWTEENPMRVIINQVFNPDFSDLIKLKEKIQTYMLFS